MNSKYLLTAFICFACFAAPFSLRAQIYSFSGGPVGFTQIDLGFAGDSGGGSSIVFGTVNATLTYNASAQTLRQVGSVNFSPTNLSFNILPGHQPGSPSGSAQLTINGGVSNILFDSGDLPSFFGFLLSIPVAGTCTVVSNGQTNIGPVSFIVTVPINTRILSVNSNSLTFTDSENGSTVINGSSQAKMVGSVGGISLWDGEDDNTYEYQWGMVSVTALAVTPPNITTNPVSATASINGNVSFNVSATEGNLAYQWKFNNTIIPGATNSTLALTSLTGAAAGSYTVTVTNAAGGATSTPAVLSLLNLNMYAGLTVWGVVGDTYEIDYQNSLGGNWTSLTTFILTNSPYLYIDTNSTFFSHRFYRAVKQ